MKWRKWVILAVAVVLVVELGLAALWWRRPAPLPMAGRLGKEPVRYRRIADKMDYTKLKESKYREPQTPEQLVHEFFVAMNTNDWERFKHLTVGREGLVKDMNLKTEEEQRNCMTGIGQLGARGMEALLTHVIQHRDEWYVVVIFDPKGWRMPILFPVVQKYGSWRVDLSDLDLKRNPCGQQLKDRNQYEKLN
jgi:hypothetical protein